MEQVPAWPRELCALPRPSEPASACIGSEESWLPVHLAEQNGIKAKSDQLHSLWAPCLVHFLFWYSLKAKNGFYVFSMVGGKKNQRLFCVTWKLCKFHSLVSISKVLLEYGHTSSFTCCLCPVPEAEWNGGDRPNGLPSPNYFLAGPL